MNKMEFTIKVINEKREGISQRTGNNWKRQDIICEWTDGERMNMQKFTLYGDDVDQFGSLAVGIGDRLLATPHWGTEMYNGNVYNLNSLHQLEKC